MFLFVDEMQDSDECQINILDSIFPLDPKMIIQRIGDPNQAIYHDQVQSEGCWSPRNPLNFSDTRRYGKTITHLLNTVRLYDNVTLKPYDLIASQPTYLIIYRGGEEQIVIRAFAHLIEELSGMLPENGIHKAIGWIGKNATIEGKLCIPTYFPKFDKTHGTPSKSFANLISYAAYAIQVARIEGAKRFLEIIMQGITRALDVASIRDETLDLSYTPVSFDYFWKHENEKSYYQFREHIAEYFLLACDSTATPVALRNKIKSEMQLFLPTSSKSTAFLDDDSINTTLDADYNIAHSKNQFVADNGIVIHIGTVHSVKGETHTATLYMDTYYQRATDSERLIKFLNGERPAAEIEKAYHRRNLKVAHVAFSRPTHLLAFACRESSITGHEDELRKNGWMIRTVSELIEESRGAS